MSKIRRSLWFQYFKLTTIAILTAILVRVFMVSAYSIKSGSMEGTLTIDDFVLVNKLAYIVSQPEVGDIIVFKYPNGPNRDLIKRVVALPGQVIEVKGKKVYVDGDLFPEPEYAQHIDKQIIPDDESFRDNFGPYTVPDGEYFVLGDNRDDSRDSRFWGCVPRKSILGKAVMIYFSWRDGRPIFSRMFTFL